MTERTESIPERTTDRSAKHTDLVALLARAEAAEGPDRELDALIWCWDRGCDFIKIADGTEAYGDLCQPGDHGYGWKSKIVRGHLVFRHRTRPQRGNVVQCYSDWTRFTASLDAALALVERTMIPGLLDVGGSWEPVDKAVWPAWTVRWYPAGTDSDGKAWHAQVGSARTPALALLAALLKALLIADADTSE